MGIKHGESTSNVRIAVHIWFPVLSRSNQEVVEDAFLPTLKTLLNAPTSSPLAEVNVENVAELLVQLSNARLLMENQSNPEGVKVCINIVLFGQFKIRERVSISEKI